MKTPHHSRKSVNHRYTWQVTILPIAFIMITAGVLSFLSIYEILQEKEQEIQNVTTEFINSQKEIVKNRVLTTAELIQFQQSQTMELVRTRVKERVDEAIHICNAFYETYNTILPEQQLKEQLQLLLSEAVFDHPDGYFLPSIWLQKTLSYTSLMR